MFVALQEKYAPEPSLVALFSFVHLDPETKRPAPIPQIEVTTPQEQAWAAERQLVATQRKALRQAGKEGRDTCKRQIGIEDGAPRIMGFLWGLGFRVSVGLGFRASVGFLWGKVGELMTWCVQAR